VRDFQYPRFLKNHWKFYKTAYGKLYKFMTDSTNIQGFKLLFMILLKIGKNCGGYKTKGFIFAKKKIFLYLRPKKQFLGSIAFIVYFIYGKKKIKNILYVKSFQKKIKNQWI
jgi:hypothetical protein